MPFKTGGAIIATQKADLRRAAELCQFWALSRPSLRSGRMTAMPDKAALLTQYDTELLRAKWLTHISLKRVFALNYTSLDAN